MYKFADHQGSVRTVLYQDSTPLRNHDYDAFGQVRPRGGFMEHV